MLSFTVRMRFSETDLDKVTEILRQLSAASRLEPGCVSYVAHFVVDEPGTVMIYEQYRDDAALEHHRSSPHFHQYAVGGLYNLMRNRQLENLDAVV